MEPRPVTTCVPGGGAQLGFLAELHEGKLWHVRCLIRFGHDLAERAARKDAA